MNAADLKLTIHFMSEEPLSAARRLESTSASHASVLLASVPANVASEVLKFMMPQVAADVLQQMSADESGAVLSYLNVAEISSIYRHLNKMSLLRLLGYLPASRRARCLTLINYPAHTVGALVDTHALVLDAQMRVDEALIRAKKKEFPGTEQIYVLDAKRHVFGTVSIYTLLRKPKTILIREFASTSPPVISGFTELSAARDLTCWQHHDTVAVVNRKREYVGIVHHHALRDAQHVKTRRFSKSTALPGELMGAYGAVISALLDTLSSDA